MSRGAYCPSAIVDDVSSLSKREKKQETNPKQLLAPKSPFLFFGCRSDAAPLLHRKANANGKSTCITRTLFTCGSGT